MDKLCSIRDVVYGFITLDPQEQEIINHQAFQRLRRIKQLALTDMVYPGAGHTRFEHSLGIMQMATEMYNNIVLTKKELLVNDFKIQDSGINRNRKIIRLAALLHDIGHPPFSHAGEGLMELLPASYMCYSKYDEEKEKHYEHEDFSITIIKTVFKDIIERHPINRNYGIRVEDVTALLGDKQAPVDLNALLWKEIISGQLDADRADYLLRDSLHLGVNYGLYDKNRLINCITIGLNDAGSPTLAISVGGWHIAESLVIARYQMFCQVYFHKTRRIYDYHIYNAMKAILKNTQGGNDCYPAPDHINDYLKLDDWSIMGYIKQGLGEEHGSIILNRNHYKCIFESDTIPTARDLEKISQLEKEHDGTFYIDRASTLWYKIDTDIEVWDDSNGRSGNLVPLSVKSSIVKSMVSKATQIRFYIKRS